MNKQKINKLKEENFHSTCQTCKKLIPNKHFDCVEEIKAEVINKVMKHNLVYSEKCDEAVKEAYKQGQKDMEKENIILKVGQRLKTECISCEEDEIWEIESIGKVKYDDGIFRCYNLKAVKNCISDTARTNLKDVPEDMREFEIIN